MVLMCQPSKITNAHMIPPPSKQATRNLLYKPRCVLISFLVGFLFFQIGGWHIVIPHASHYRNRCYYGVIRSSTSHIFCFPVGETGGTMSLMDVSQGGFTTM